MLLAATEAQEAAGVRKKAEGNGGAPAEKVGRAVAEGECVREADVETLQRQKQTRATTFGARTSEQNRIGAACVVERDVAPRRVPD